MCAGQLFVICPAFREPNYFTKLTEMKKLFLSVLVLVIAGSAFSQTKPVSGDISLGFQVTGLSNIAFKEWGTDAFEVPQVLGRYYLSDQIALRTRLGVNLTNVDRAFDRTFLLTEGVPNAVRVDSSLSEKVSGFSFSISPGIEYHLASDAEKLDPYVGASIPFAMQTPIVTDRQLDVVNTNAAGTILYREDINTKTTTNSSLSIGLNLIGGFNYFFSPKIAIGAEYALGFAYNDIGGFVTLVQTGFIQPTSDPNNIINANVSSNIREGSNSLELGFRSTGGVNVSIFW